MNSDGFDPKDLYPWDGISDEEMEGLKDRLNKCMPLDSMIMDLWDWSIHFEEDLSDDWYFSAALGSPEELEFCASELADFFIEKSDEYAMDYDQYDDPDFFEEMVKDEAKRFVSGWRHNILTKSSHQTA